MAIDNTKALEIYRKARAEKRIKAIETKRIESDHAAFAQKMAYKKTEMEARIITNNPNLTPRQVSQVAERAMRYGR